jgi:hypothetical protein
MQFINKDKRSVDLLLDDEVLAIDDSQLPAELQGTFVNEEPSIRPVNVANFVKPAFKNDYNWFPIDKEDDFNTNGPLAAMKWRFTGTDAEFMEPKDDKSDLMQTPLEYFLAVMSPASIKRILNETIKTYMNKKRMKWVLQSFFGSLACVFW